MKFCINGEVFKTKKALQERVRGILNSTAGEVRSEELPFLLDLFRLHQDADLKFGTGVSTVRVVLAQPYKTRCFEIERVDGSRTDISYLECLNPSGPEKWFSAACRTAVVDQIQAFKDAVFAPSYGVNCPITGEVVTRDTCHVDHKPPVTFERLVAEFLSEEGIKVDRVKFIDGDNIVESRFAETEMAEAFAAFHAARAELRVVSKRANLSLIKRTER